MLRRVHLAFTKRLVPTRRQMRGGCISEVGRARQSEPVGMANRWRGELAVFPC